MAISPDGAVLVQRAQEACGCGSWRLAKRARSGTLRLPWLGSLGTTFALDVYPSVALESRDKPGWAISAAESKKARTEERR